MLILHNQSEGFDGIVGELTIAGMIEKFYNFARAVIAALTISATSASAFEISPKKYGDTILGGNWSFAHHTEQKNTSNFKKKLCHVSFLVLRFSLLQRTGGPKI